MSRRILAEYRQTFILRIMATAVLLFIAFLCSESSIVVLICLVLLVLFWIWGFREKIVVYPNLLEKQSLFGTTTVPLNAKTEFFYKFVNVRIEGINTGQHTYIRVRNGYQEIKANSNIKDIDQLRERLIQLEVHNLQPQIQKSLQEKSSLNFGILKVSSSGLAYKNSMITYTEISDSGIENGFFYVKKQGKTGNFMRISISEIPNMTTFFALFHHYMEEKLTA